MLQPCPLPAPTSPICEPDIGGDARVSYVDFVAFESSTALGEFLASQMWLLSSPVVPLTAVQARSGHSFFISCLFYLFAMYFFPGEKLQKMSSLDIFEASYFE